MLIPRSFVNGVNLTDSAATYYTVPAAAKGIVMSASFCNDHSSPVTVTINFVPSGGSATYANQIRKTKALAAGETWDLPGLPHVLEAGGFISMVASVTAKVGARISGYEYTA